MTEYVRDKILPEDMIQRTNLQQHNFMIDAINDIDGRQGDIERVTNVNIDDIADLKTDVNALSDEKLDKADIDEDIHFGPITITKDGTAVIASFDAINPTTGTVTPLSFLLPGATATDAGVMDASSVAWITEAEARISALEGLSDVKAVADLPSTPTHAQLTTGWVAVAGKPPETGDILQDINNSKLWVFVGTDWVLYGTIVTVPLATTSTIGGVRDTSLTASGNRWYVHVEADGRLSLIGGDSLSTLLDTTVPGIQTAVNGKVSKTGDETIGGVKTFTNTPVINGNYASINLKSNLSNSNLFFYNNGNEGHTTLIRSQDDGATSAYTRITTTNIRTGTAGALDIVVDDVNGEGYATVQRRTTPGNNDIVNKGYLDTRLTAKQDKLTFDSVPTTGSVNPVTSGGVKTAIDTKQDKLTFDTVPTAGSANPVTSGGVYNALDAKASKTEVNNGLALKADLPTWTYGSGTLTTNAGTCGYNYAYSTIGDVVTMRFTVGPSVDTQFTVPLPVSVNSASVQCIGISDDAKFWADYGGTATNTITVNRTQTTIQDRSFHMLVIGQPLN